MSDGYAKIFEAILDSTVWGLSKEARILWITILVKKGRDQVVRASVPGLARAARLTPAETLAALVELEAPDPDSQSKEMDGRRIVRLQDGGWFVVTGEKYRRMMSVEERREYKRGWQADYRAKLKLDAEPAPDPFSEPATAEPPDMADLVVPPEMKKVGSVTAANTDSPAEAQAKRPEYRGEPRAVGAGPGEVPPVETSASQHVPVSEVPPAADQNGPVAVRPARVRAPWSRPADPAAPASDFP